jgi:hypothetical protein
MSKSTFDKGFDSLKFWADNLNMNSRDYKILRAGNYYHIYNRGNNKQLIFLESEDYLVFLNRLKLALGISKIGLSGKQSRVRVTPFPESSFEILCYCLMPNHYHFLIKQLSNFGIDELMARVCTSYVKYFNKKYGAIGNLFQDRFKAKLVDSDSYIKYLSAYIHNNPEDADNYDYSSYKDYLGSRKGTICKKDFILSMFGNSNLEYSIFVRAFGEKELGIIKDLAFDE